MRVFAVALLGIVGGAGVFGGMSFLGSPDGGAMGLSPAQLPEWSPVDDYTIAGWLLLVLFGLLPLAAAALLFPSRRLGFAATAGIGLALVGWMAFQFVAIGLLLPPMQFAFLFLGLALAALGALGLQRPQRSPAAHRVESRLSARAVRMAAH